MVISSVNSVVKICCDRIVYFDLVNEKSAYFALRMNDTTSCSLENLTFPIKNNYSIMEV